MTSHPSGAPEPAWADRLPSFEQETILRVRRGAKVWEATNRRAPAAGLGADTTPTTGALRGFRTASLSKTFTAALTLRLWEERALDLDDTLDRHLPAVLCARLPRFDGHPITIRLLLNHRSGLYDYATDAQFVAEVAAAPLREWSPQDLLDAALRQGSPYFAPGQGLAYSDTGYVLLGLIIERCSGMPLARAYRRHLLDQLGLRHTYLEGHEPANADIEVASAFAGTIDTSGFNPSFDTFGGGGLISTAVDLDRFITALMRGQVYTRTQTLTVMLEGTEAPPGSGTRKTRTACGLSEFEIAGQRLWGHLGHWNSFMLYQPKADLALCGSFNQAQADPRQVALLEAAVRDALEWDGA